ncbi:MAG TPA: putative metalloprotease CJM1_0395 family protein [Fibrobacteria bacterium]|nr:putative metalloprotease CJM1_0395 family protein [Fibrobacteria bacterium]
MEGVGGFSRIGSATSPSLSDDDRDALRRMKETDRKVRAHEQAHLSAAGDSAQGGMRLETKVGPDGKPYAVSGEVSIKVSGGRTPEESLRKAQTAHRAALAPADPSPQDLKVAQKAAQAEHQARQQMQATSTGASSRRSGGYSPAAPTGANVDLVA